MRAVSASGVKYFGTGLRRFAADHSRESIWLCHGGADHADNDAGGCVRDSRGFRQWRASRNGHGQHGRHSVARARYVEYFVALKGGNVRPANRPPMGFEEIHSSRSTSDEDRLEAERSHQRFRSSLDLGVWSGSDAARHSVGELLLVWRQQVRAAVLAKIAALRIDGHERTSTPFDDRAKYAFRENALVVIRAHDSGRTSSCFFHGARHEPLISRRQRRACLAIDAKHVLAACHHARLQCRRPVARSDDTLDVDARALERSQQPSSRLVISDNPDEPHAAPERGEVERGVRRAAGSVRFALPTKHLHRRFGRDTLDIAPHVVVAHDVADNENGRRRDGQFSHLASRLSPTCQPRPATDQDRRYPMHEA